MANDIKPTGDGLYERQNIGIHNELIRKVFEAWDNLDPERIIPLLAPDLHYYSWWVISEMHTKEEYADYIRGKFKTIKERNFKPQISLVKGENTGKEAILMRQEGCPTVLLKLEEKNGLISEMWMQGV